VGSRIEVVEELDAAANAYAAEMQERCGSDPRTVLIVDFGAGKLDIGVYRIDGHRATRIYSGGKEWGGRDIDFALAHHYLQEFGIDLRSSEYDDEGRARIFSHFVDQCRRAKEALSTKAETELALTDPESSVRLGSKTLTRVRFDEIFAAQFEEVRSLVKGIVDGGTVNDLDDVLLLGGSCRICAVRKRIFDVVKRPDRKRQYDLLVVRGAISEIARRSEVQFERHLQPNSTPKQRNDQGFPPSDDGGQQLRQDPENLGYTDPKPVRARKEGWFKRWCLLF
jgi:molecular chaperone DnaK (HSP70)